MNERDHLSGVRSAAAGTSSDAAAYAFEYHLSLEQAAQRLVLQEQLAPVMAKMRAVAGPLLGGATFTHDPFGVAVRVVSSAPIAALDRLAESDPLIRLRYVVGPTWLELKTEIDQKVAAWTSTYPEIQGLFVEETDSVIGVDAVGDVEASERLEAALEATTEFRVHVFPAATKATDLLQGGLPMNDSGRRVCTSGFSIQDNNSQKTGVLSAEHCPYSMDYENWQDTFHGSTVTYRSSRNSQADVQWLRDSDNSAQPSFYAESTSSSRPLYGAMSRSEVVGEFACHRGVASASRYSCGTVSTASYKPTYPNACPSTCDNTWGRMSGPNLECAGGDSGGPVFTEFEADGITKGGATTGPTAADCDFMIFMPIGFAQIHLDVHLRYS